MIYRVCIVDDESYIADSTAMRLRNDSAQEMEVSVFCRSKTALESIRSARIDILIADIRMPEMSGLELMEETQRLWPKCQVILLTAHTEFDYVYQVVRKPSVDYVLKQEGYDALSDAVQRALNRINTTQMREDQLAAARIRAQAALPWLEREFLMDLTHGAQYDGETLERTKRQLALSVDVEKPACLLMPVLRSSGVRETLIDRMERMNALELLARDYLPENTKMVSVQVDENRLLWLWQFSEQPTDVQIESMLEGVQSAADNQLSRTVSFAYSPQQVAWEDYPRVYGELNALAARRMMGSAQPWIESVGDREVGAYRTPLNQTARWSRAYRVHDPDADRELEQLLTPLVACPSVEDAGYMQLYLQIAMPLAQVMQESELSRQQCVELRSQCLYDPRAHATPAQAAEYLRFVAGQLIALRRENTDNSIRAVIAHVQDYIRQHLSEDISLTKLAEYVHVNASYLSRVFKQETGSNLKDYIWELRLNRACELLRRPDLRIQEVGAQLGFQTSSYFSYFFKKGTGLTPREFRDTLANPSTNHNEGK